jgi:hypothetical protein
VGVFRCHVGWADNAEGNAEGGRGVEAEGHGGDIPASAPPCQPHRHPCIEQVSEEDPHGASRDHPVEDYLPRHLERPSQDGRHYHETGHVVEHEAEEGIDVADAENGVALFHILTCHVLIGCPEILPAGRWLILADCRRHEKPYRL